jgi:HPt (histidine-containing phosphotransfer) domain-containing protein
MLHSGDLRGTVQLLHTHKGLALTVGARHLAAICRLAEIQIKAALAHVPDLRSAVAAASHALTHAGASLAPSPPAGTPGAGAITGSKLHTSERGPLQADLQALRVLLKSSDLRALEIHSALLRQHAALDPTWLEPLNSTILAFDFLAAVVQCEKLIHELSHHRKSTLHHD